MNVTSTKAKITNARTFIDEIEANLGQRFKEIDDIALFNQEKVLSAFAKHKLCQEHFSGKTGYGIDDIGRDTIDDIFATVFGAQKAIVRMQFVCGTHALACALLGNLRPQENMLCITGRPYDTMEKVIGLKGKEAGSLKTQSIGYKEIDLIPHLTNHEKMQELLQNNIDPATKLVYIQKSRGYSFERPTLSVREIEILITQVRKTAKDIIVMVDNCYGEFVEKLEPTQVDADIIAGSLIKNPGGGLAISGGYIAGKKDVVENAVNRLTAPGVGSHIGLTYDQNRLILQGLFLAPSVVANATKGAILAASIMEALGYDVCPAASETRFDIIQAIKFGNAQDLISFCKSIQMSSPVDAFVLPEPADMPGYEDKVIMAGGTFIEGSTIELSADGPLRSPFAAYLQGGLTYYHCKLAMLRALEALLAQAQ